MGMLFGLGILWLVGGSSNRGNQRKTRTTDAGAALMRIDMSSVIFFSDPACGGDAGATTHPSALGRLVWPNHRSARRDRDRHRPDQRIVDNVPLVAASMGMLASSTPAGQLPLGIPRLLRRDGRLDPDHRLRGRVARDGAREDSTSSGVRGASAAWTDRLRGRALVYIVQYRLTHG